MVFFQAPVKNKFHFFFIINYYLLLRLHLAKKNDPYLKPFKASEKTLVK